MDAQELLKRWQRVSGVFPIGETKRQLMCEWEQILYLESGDLEKAVQTAIVGEHFTARDVEIIALNMRAGTQNRAMANRRHCIRKIRRPPTSHPK